ncbi:hypothetical protein QQP08_015834 [Theobroma cacao]|nr:hypothetical protein QQP08_015834 [Theobroma cacao]
MELLILHTLPTPCLSVGFGCSYEHLLLIHTILQSWLCWHLGCFNNLYEFACDRWSFKDRYWHGALELSQRLIAANISLTLSFFSLGPCTLILLMMIYI